MYLASKCTIPRVSVMGIFFDNFAAVKARLTLFLLFGSLRAITSPTWKSEGK